MTAPFIQILEPVMGPMSILTGTLYTSGHKAATNESRLNEYDIKLVISAMQLDEANFKPYTNVGKNGIDKVEIFRVDDLESSDISKYFYDATNLIAEFLFTGRNVLVHCESGFSRAPTLVIAFMMRFYFQTFNEALAELTKIESRISPNFGFRTQLKEYEKFLKVLERKEAGKNPLDIQVNFVNQNHFQILHELANDK